MKTQTSQIDAVGLEREIAALAPALREILNRSSGTPSERTLRAIHEEAAAQIFARRRHALHQWRLAAAASLLLLLGGTALLYHTRSSGRQAQTLRLVLHIGAPNTANGPVEGTKELANRLLNIQGLDEDSFFNPDGTEVLAL